MAGGDHRSGRKNAQAGRIGANTRPIFFVSYAHDFKRDDEYVRRFHEDLSDEVRLFSGLRHDHVGFCDSSLRAGDLWSPALVDALRNCQVFLALCSPTYFSRPSCGKEWAIFTRRLAAVPAARRPAATSPLIPLFWVPMAMPEIAAPYQYRDSAFGEAYRRQALRDLVRLARNKDQYWSFVSALARRVLELVEQIKVPPYPHRPEFDAVEPAFPAAPSSTGAPPAPRQARRAARPSTVDASEWPKGARPILDIQDLSEAEGGPR